MEDLLLTPLHEEHLKLKAKMIPFDGFDMPVQYTGIMCHTWGKLRYVVKMRLPLRTTLCPTQFYR